MNEVTVAQPNEVSVKILNSYLDSFGIAKNLTQEEKMQFVGIAHAWGLNPFKREIHVSAYGEGAYRQCSIIVGYEVYIKRAERTNKLKGWKAWTEGSVEGKNLVAKVQIYRSDWEHPFEHEAYFDECAQYKKDGTINAFWNKQPRFMLKKVAIGQAFRLCFSDDLGGMPYAEGELPMKEAEPTDFNQQVAIDYLLENGLTIPLIEKSLGHAASLITKEEARELAVEVKKAKAITFLTENGMTIESIEKRLGHNISLITKEEIDALTLEIKNQKQIENKGSANLVKEIEKSQQKAEALAKAALEADKPAREPATF
jgi:phage recombination protein Bet